MRLVVVESPLAAPTPEGAAENRAYACRCARHVLDMGDSPYASHLFFDQPGILDDLVPEERKLGIAAGFAWGERADVVAVYIDRGVSRGMRAGIREAMKRDQCIEVRSLEREVPREEGMLIVLDAIAEAEAH
jgi:hypothetical protein